MCYNVSIINNMAFEKTEDFTLHIIFVETDNVIATVNYTRIYVVDDDGTLVSEYNVGISTPFHDCSNALLTHSIPKH